MLTSLVTKPKHNCHASFQKAFVI